MVPGIIPLVPGGLAFDATKNLVLLDFSKAINTMLEVTLIAGAIALGLLFADQISKIILSGFARTRKNITSFILLLIIRSAWLPRARAFKDKLIYKYHLPYLQLLFQNDLKLIDLIHHYPFASI